MVSKLAAGVVVVIVVVCGGAAAYVLTRPPEAAETYTLTPSVNPSGSGSVSPSSGTYDAGTSVTLTATPASGYSFSHWGGDASGTSASVSITMNSDKDLIAYFTAVPTYELFYDYQVGEYYNYEMTTTSTTDTTTENVSSTYSMQVTAVEDNEITAKYLETIENIGPPLYEYTIESAEVTSMATMTNKGKMISWEIENVVPPELWENVELYENSTMAYSQLLENLQMFPRELIPICENWGVSISGEIEWMPGTYMPLTGEGSVHFVGQESVTVDAGTFDCWRLDYGASISGELTNGYTATMNMTFAGTSWYNKLNCAEVKSTMSMTMSMESDGYTYESFTNMVTELVEYGTT